ERDALGLAGHKSERGVALKHRVLGRREPLHLEPVIHHRQGRAARFLGSLSGGRKSWAQRGVPAWKGEVHEVECEFHWVTPAWVWMRLSGPRPGCGAPPKRACGRRRV